MIKRYRNTQPNSYIRSDDGVLTPRNYLDALYSCLVELKPKRCLEIGTNLGNSARVFQEYFSNNNNDGLLASCDIQQYVDLSDLKNIHQVRVYPHIIDFSLHHIDTNKLLPDYKEVYYAEATINNNIEILKEYGPFDFIFLDGDHQAESVHKDLEISLALLSDGGKILFDDIAESHHDSCGIYHNELKPKFNHYEFEDWDVAVGAALIWKK